MCYAMEKRECWDKKGECGGGFKGGGQGKPTEKRDWIKDLQEVRKALQSPIFTYQVCSIWFLRASIISLAKTSQPHFSVRIFLSCQTSPRYKFMASAFAHIAHPTQNAFSYIINSIKLKMILSIYFVPSIVSRLQGYKTE